MNAIPYRGYHRRMIKHNSVNPRAVHAAQVAGRLIIYLDTNVWIDLVEARTETARDAILLARKLHGAGKAIFPISYASASELLKQRVSDISRRQAKLMDELSDRVSFRAIPHIRDVEVRRVYEYLVDGDVQDHSSEIFTVAANYSGDTLLSYPEGWSEEDAIECTESLRRNLPGLAWMQEHMPRSNFERFYPEVDAEWVQTTTELDAQALLRFAQGDGTPSVKKLRHEEHSYILNRYIAPVMPRLVGQAATFLAMHRGAERIGRGGPKTVARIVRLMSSIWLACEMNVHRRLARN